MSTAFATRGNWCMCPQHATLVASPTRYTWRNHIVHSGLHDHHEAELQDKCWRAPQGQALDLSLKYRFLLTGLCSLYARDKRFIAQIARLFFCWLNTDCCSSRSHTLTAASHSNMSSMYWVIMPMVPNRASAYESELKVSQGTQTSVT